MRVVVIVLMLALSACVKIPDGIEPVSEFDVNRYLGTWYEIARLDHSFERGLQNVTAEYSLREDGGIKVINQGFDTKKNAWSNAEGKVYFVESEEVGFFKVSFFGPFYGSYIIFDLGDTYEYSLVTGNDRSYFWLLSRTPTLEEALQNDLLKKVEELGFDTQSLIFVEQTPIEP